MSGLPETPHPAPSRTVRVPFTPRGSRENCETAVFQYGELSPTTIPLICVHGGPAATSLSVLPLANLQPKHGLTVLLYDQLGCGESTRLPGTKGNTDLWNIDTFTAELKNILDHFKIQQYDLLGHSFGGHIVGSFVLTQPPGLRKVIMFSSPTSVRLRVAASRRQRSELPDEHRIALEKGDSGATDTPEYKAADEFFFRRHLYRLDPLPETILKMNDACSEDSCVAVTLYGPSPFLESTEASVGQWDIRPRLVEITDTTTPGGLLLLNGRYDTAPDDTMVAYFTEPKARVRWITLEQSSHMAHFEEPERFLEIVGSFLKM